MNFYCPPERGILAASMLAWTVGGSVRLRLGESRANKIGLEHDDKADDSGCN
jgi:hypothetical protein